MTKNEKIEKVETLRHEARKLSGSTRVAYFWVGFFLLVVTGINALSATLHGFNPISLVLAALPAVSLFACSYRLERSGVKGAFGALFVISAVVSGFISWVHTYEVLTHYGQIAPIALLFPIILDVPMVLLMRGIMVDKARIAEIGHEVHMLANVAIPARRANTAKTDNTVKATRTPRTRANTVKPDLSVVTA